jgi:hypothetical protein
MLSIPIKLKNVDGDLQQLTTAEENYLAYQASLELAATSGDSAGDLTTSSTSSFSVGSFTDTFFNEAIGTHPASALSTGTTTTTLYQKTGTPTAIASLERKPLATDSDGNFYEMADSDMNILTDRLNSVIHTNDYPGTFKLGSSSPGGTYSSFISSIFTDTRTDGTSVAYSIYRNGSIASPPSGDEYVSIKRSGGNTGSYEGLQETTTNQLKHTLGNSCKERRGASGNIGSYQLRTSGQGSPTAAGTWVAKGTATDTKQTTEESTFVQNYTGEYVAQYSKSYTGQYTRQYAGLDPCTFTPAQPTVFSTTDPCVVSQPTSFSEPANPTVFSTTDPCVLAQPTSFAAPNTPTTYTPAQPTTFYTTDPCSFYTSDPTTYTPAQPTSFSGSDPTSFSTSTPTTYTPAQPTSFSGSDPTSFTTFGPKIGTSVFYTTAPTTFNSTDPCSFSSSDPTTFSTSAPTSFSGTDPCSFTTSDPTTFTPAQPTSFGSTDPCSFASSDPTTFYTTDPCTVAQPTSIPGTEPTVFATSDPTTLAQPTSIPGTDPCAFTPAQPTSYGGLVDKSYIKQYAKVYAGAYAGVDYAGTTIASGSQTIETYTLYVRVA